MKVGDTGGSRCEDHARTVDCCAMQPSERRLLLRIHSSEVTRHVQIDCLLECLGREPAEPVIRLAHHDEWLPQPPSGRELKHALARADVLGREEHQQG